MTVLNHVPQIDRRYNSIFSSAWLCQQRSWYRTFAHRLSVRVAIISELNTRISFKFWLLLPLGHTLELFFLIFNKRSKDLGALLDSCSWDDIGNFLQACIKNSLLQTKSTEIWVNSHTVPCYAYINEFYSFSLTWDPMGAKISKCYSSYKSQSNVLKLLLNIPPNGPHKSTVFEFWNVDLLIFNDLFVENIANSPL